MLIFQVLFLRHEIESSHMTCRVDTQSYTCWFESFSTFKKITRVESTKNCDSGRVITALLKTQHLVLKKTRSTLLLNTSVFQWSTSRSCRSAKVRRTMFQPRARRGRKRLIVNVRNREQNRWNARSPPPSERRPAWLCRHDVVSLAILLYLFLAIRVFYSVTWSLSGSPVMSVNHSFSSYQTRTSFPSEDREQVQVINDALLQLQVDFTMLLEYQQGPLWLPLHKFYYIFID